MDYVFKAIIAIIIIAVVAYTLIYIVPTLLPRVTYIMNYSAKPMIIINSNTPGFIRVNTYNGSQIRISNTITYSPLIPRPSIHYVMEQTNNTLYAQSYSTTCPSEQFYPIYTCIISTNIYLPTDVSKLLLKASASIVSIQVNNISFIRLDLSSSTINVKLSNIVESTLNVFSSTGVIKMQGVGNYSINAVSSTITMYIPPYACIRMNATASMITYPGGSVNGSGSRNLIKTACLINITLYSTSSTILIV